MIVPLAFAALYMWTMWDPTKTIKNLPVAIVNDDVPFHAGNDEIHAGRDVTDNLVESRALDFQNVDAATAASGLRDGTYYFVISIPKDFSETLSGIGDVTVAPALMTVTYNDNNTLKASSIGAAAMSTINAAVLKGVAGTTVGTVLDGLDALGGGLRTAAVGADRLQAGTAQLRNGLDELADGVRNELAPGIAAANTGARQVSDGTDTLAGGLVALRNGTDELGAGATRLADGIDTLVGTVDIDAVKRILDDARRVAPSAGLEEASRLIDGLGELRAGSRRLAVELTDPSAQYRSGLDQLVVGGGSLAAGSARLADGLDRIQEGTGEVAVGVGRLQDGARQVDDGARKLSDGLSDGARRAPDLGDQTKRQSLASLLATPVASESKNLAPAQNAGPGAAPTLLIFACGIGVIAVFTSFRGHRFLTEHDAPPPSLRTVVRRAVAVSAVSLATTAVVGGVLWMVLAPSPSPASLGQVAVIAGAATLMNVALTSVLFTLFGYAAGALTSLAWLMLQIFSYGGIWMVETLPAPFRLLHPIAPMSYVRDGMIAAFNGTSGFGMALGIVIAITVAAAAVNFGAVAAARHLHRNRVRDGDVVEFAEAVAAERP
ncbi:YhgE/Pip family protein [Gordonia sp. HY285]|nr:YhgE/Pip family protein [Gordonia liuliyuniae]